MATHDSARSNYRKERDCAALIEMVMDKVMRKAKAPHDVGCYTYDMIREEGGYMIYRIETEEGQKRPLLNKRVTMQDVMKMFPIIYELFMNMAVPTYHDNNPLLKKRRRK